MSGFNLSEWIAATPDAVFEALSSPQRAPEIMPNIKSMVQTTSGEIGPGTKFLETRIVNGKEAQTALEVVSYRRPDEYGVTAEQSGIEVTYTYRLQESDGGTQIDLTCEVSTSGLRRFLLPVVAGIMKREDGQHLEQLKRALEG